MSQVASDAKISSVFANLKNAKASFDSNYLRPGSYYLRIDRVVFGTTRKMEDFFAIEMTCLHVLDAAQEHQNPGNVAHRVWESCTHMLMVKQDSFLPNVKAFLANVLGAPDDQITEDLVKEVAGAKQILTRTIVEVRATTGISKTKGTKFTKVKYVREVPMSEMLKIDPQVVAQAFPEDYVKRAIASESQA